MTNTWFNNFLQSLFDRIGTDTKGLWLTEAQTNAFIKNCEGVGYGHGKYRLHADYGTEWNGRKVTMSFSQKSKRGNIVFSMVEEEADTSYNSYLNNRIQEKMEAIEKAKIRFKDDVEKMNSRIAHYEKEIAEYRSKLE